MFNSIGFSELLLVAVVALIVVGPERLPGVIRTTLQYVRKIKAGFANIRDEVERELNLDDIKRQFSDNKAEMSKVIGFDELQDSLNELRQESESLREIAEDGFEYADAPDYVDNTEIEADLDALVENQCHHHLPDPEAEAETGIEKLRN